jgi:hypothetical protein
MSVNIILIRNDINTKKINKNIALIFITLYILCINVYIFSKLIQIQIIPV